MHKPIKKKPSYKKEREMKIKRAIKRAIATLTILAILAVAGYFLYPAFQSGEIQSSFQSVGENISSWWNESGNYLPPATLSKPEINIPELEKQIHDLINGEREKRGLPALAWNDKLNIIARKHSKTWLIETILLIAIQKVMIFLIGTGKKALIVKYA